MSATILSMISDRRDTEATLHRLIARHQEELTRQGGELSTIRELRRRGAERLIEAAADLRRARARLRMVIILAALGWTLAAAATVQLVVGP